jgi:metal-responsive CopG/Arc/MetJ family transcriptional regulator
MATKQSQFAPERVYEIRLSAELTKRIDQWTKANGEDSRSEALRQLLVRGFRSKKRTRRKAEAFTRIATR